MKIGIIISEFNYWLNNALLDGALHRLSQHNIDVFPTIWVPGALEIPLTAQKFIHAKTPTAIIALGSVIKGDTPHFDVVTNQSASGLMHVSLIENTPIINGILTINTVAQALSRVGLDPSLEIAKDALQKSNPNPLRTANIDMAHNKGAQVATSAIELLVTLNAL